MSGWLLYVGTDGFDGAVECFDTARQAEAFAATYVRPWHHAEIAICPEGAW